MPATSELLHTFFPAYSSTYKSVWTPNASGESIEELYDRSAYVLTRLIEELETSPSSPRSILICTHAATATAISRVLTGNKPESPTDQEFIPWTASLSTFRRRRFEPVQNAPHLESGEPLPKIPWAKGHGIGGGWDLVVNADCSFLARGRERGWRFSGRESFDHAVVSHGIDAGSGLGVIVECEKSQVNGEAGK